MRVVTSVSQRFFSAVFCSVVGAIICLLLVYTVLLCVPSCFSLREACCMVGSASGVPHLLLTVLLPFYVALLVFGGAAVGWRAGRLFYRLLTL